MALKAQFQMLSWPVLAKQPINVGLEILENLQLGLYNLVYTVYTIQFWGILVQSNHLNNITRNYDVCVGYSDLSISVIVKHLEHTGLIIYYLSKISRKTNASQSQKYQLFRKFCGQTKRMIPIGIIRALCLPKRDLRSFSVPGVTEKVAGFCFAGGGSLCFPNNEINHVNKQTNNTKSSTQNKKKLHKNITTITKKERISSRKSTLNDLCLYYQILLFYQQPEVVPSKAGQRQELTFL